MSTFLKGRPLNVTDLDVGPDGALYFSHGRPRHRWRRLSRPLDRHARPPQTIQLRPGHSSRRSISRSSKATGPGCGSPPSSASLGDRWQTELERILTDKRNVAQRPAAGDRPADVFRSAADAGAAHPNWRRIDDPAMRVRAARLMGNRDGRRVCRHRSSAMLRDADPWVRRVACEAIAHRGDERAGAGARRPAGRHGSLRGVRGPPRAGENAGRPSGRSKC